MATNSTPIYPTKSAAPAATTCTCPACTGLNCLDRTRFFAGQLLTEADLNHEQSYLLAKNRLHNRFLHGWGVVCGMQVVCGECDGWVTVKTGYAIDPCGNDIIVCQDQPFNVIQAIQACCKPATTPNCSPLRYTPAPTCQDLTQTWCLTLQYQEQPSRMVTPLQQVSSNGSNGSCGTRGQGSTSGASSSSSCGCSSSASQTTATVPTGACEPTRIIEGFQIGVMCDPPDQQGGQNTKTVAFQQCQNAITQLVQQNPYPNGIANATSTPTYQQAYQAICSYQQTVQNSLSSSLVTHCKLESQLAGFAIPGPGANRDLSSLQRALDAITDAIKVAALDCICTSLLPVCPPDPCDNRLVLACLTVQNGQIISICHFGGGRRQVLTFPAIEYWMDLLGFDIYGAIGAALKNGLCCLDTPER
jgi:hypothetical protein